MKVPQRILVADDEPGIRRLLKKVLRRSGYVVETVADGQEAVEAAATEMHDLAILDLEMPRVSGLDALRVMTRIRPDLRFILMTGNDLDTLPGNLDVPEGTALLAKPFGVLDLVQRATEALDRGADGKPPSIWGG